MSQTNYDPLWEFNYQTKPTFTLYPYPPVTIPYQPLYNGIHAFPFTTKESSLLFIISLIIFSTVFIIIVK